MMQSNEAATSPQDLALDIASEGFVYIAGPYRAKDGHDFTVYTEIDANINIARYWAKQLAEADIPMFCPHLNSAHFEVIAPSVSQGYWLRMDLTILVHAQAIFMLPNYDTSSGALAELNYAHQWDIPAFYAEPVGGHKGLVELKKMWKEKDQVAVY